LSFKLTGRSTGVTVAEFQMPSKFGRRGARPWALGGGDDGHRQRDDQQPKR
jgi:hypothetical protein